MGLRTTSPPKLALVVQLMRERRETLRIRELTSQLDIEIGRRSGLLKQNTGHRKLERVFEDGARVNW